MRKLMTMIALLALCSVQTYAKTWTVDQRPGANFQTIAAAVASSSVLAGDTILVSGSSIAYAGFSFNKKLTLIGPGYFLGENTNLQADTNSVKISSQVTIQSGAQGSIVMGLHFLNSLYVDADNVQIIRNRFQITNTYDYGIYLYAQDSTIIRQNYLTQTASWYHCITIASGNTQTMIQNNFLEYTGGDSNSSYGALSVQGTISGDISNNVIYGNVTLSAGGFTFNNNIMRYGKFNSTGITPHNNIGSSSQFSFWPALGNQSGVNMTSVFVSSGTSDTKWQIATEGPADNNGFGGIDCGMYDNSAGTAYIPSGIPPIPSVYEFDASDLNNVTVKVKSHN